MFLERAPNFDPGAVTSMRSTRSRGQRDEERGANREQKMTRDFHLSSFLVSFLTAHRCPAACSSAAEARDPPQEQRRSLEVHRPREFGVLFLSLSKERVEEKKCFSTSTFSKKKTLLSFLSSTLPLFCTFSSPRQRHNEKHSLAPRVLSQITLCARNINTQG